MALAIWIESFFFFYILVGFALEVREAQPGAPALYKRIPQGCFSVKVKTDDTMKKRVTCLPKPLQFQNSSIHFFHIHFCDYL